MINDRLKHNNADLHKISEYDEDDTLMLLRMVNDIIDADDTEWDELQRDMDELGERHSY